MLWNEFHTHTHTRAHAHTRIHARTHARTRKGAREAFGPLPACPPPVDRVDLVLQLSMYFISCKARSSVYRRRGVRGNSRVRACVCQSCHFLTKNDRQLKLKKVILTVFVKIKVIGDCSSKLHFCQINLRNVCGNLLILLIYAPRTALTLILNFSLYFLIYRESITTGQVN